MADKILKYTNTGDYDEITPITESLGAADAGKVPMTGANGKLHASIVDIPDVGYDQEVLPAYEVIPPKSLINKFNDGGVAKWRIASAAAPFKPADAYTLLGAATAGNNCTGYYEGINDGQSGLTPGIPYFLSETVPGGVQLAVPTTAGNIAQKIGKSKSATEYHFKPEPYVKRA